MAVTILQSPQIYTPSDNPVVWVFSSDQTTQPNFYYLVEVFIDSVSIEKHRIYVESGIKAHFNAQQITSLKTDVIGYYQFSNDMQNNTLVSISVTEMYGTTISSGASATTSDITVYKSKLKKADFIDYDYNNYIVSNTGVDYLTLFPRTEQFKCGIDEMLFLSIMSDNETCTFNCSTYDESGTLISSGNYSLPTHKMTIFGTDPTWINTMIPSLVFTNVHYYEVNVTSSGNTETLRIYIDKDCTYKTHKRLHFLNSLGAIDSFTFGLIAREKYKVKSFGYERQFGGFDSSGNYTFDMYKGTVIDYLKQFSKTVELTSDWLNEEVQNWLSKELYASPLVWIEEDRKFYRCKVTNTEFDKKIQENDMLFQEVVTIELESDTSVNV